MSKPKEGRSSEFYQGQIRALKSENRNLKKRLKHYERREHSLEDQELDKIFQEVIYKKVLCMSCGKGELESHNLLGRFWTECNLCSYRSKVKKL